MTDKIEPVTITQYLMTTESILTLQAFADKLAKLERDLHRRESTFNRMYKTEEYVGTLADQNAFNAVYDGLSKTQFAIADALKCHEEAALDCGGKPNQDWQPDDWALNSPAVKGE